MKPYSYLYSKVAESASKLPSEADRDPFWAGTGTFFKEYLDIPGAIDYYTGESNASISPPKRESKAETANPEAAAQTAASPEAAAPDTPWYKHLINPTTNNADNYALLGSLGAIGAGGLAGIFSPKEKRLRNTLLFAVLGAGLGAGGKYLADRYQSTPTDPAATP